ncbi:MAG: extracellular solute-binding protein [Acidaminococcales bacterium]|jgi:iron(III) transport system substrate-binding protein|nr:extracellular solute-binding protein [Acidaminococcales bacterium]
MKKTRIKAVVAAALAVLLAIVFAGCGGAPAEKAAQKVVVYTNADKEAVDAMQNSLNGAGYEGKYIIQTMGTSELGGKLLAEGSKIEANIITMSSYFIDSAQQKNNMFEKLTFPVKTISKTADFYAPILGNTGAVFVNTEVMKAKNLPMPKSFKDLTDGKYAGFVSIPNIMNSSTAWLLTLGVLNQYGPDESKEILGKIVKNCGPHVERSGSGPIKKVRAGEVAVGFGLRHQAVGDKLSGKPMDFVDPLEGNYNLIEAVAVVKKPDQPATVKLAMEMAKVIVEKARPELLKLYPVALYEGEKVDDANKVGNPKELKEPLTVELLTKHQEFFKAATQ